MRGTSNSNQRGSSRDRARRKIFLMKTYASDIPRKCRCYRCGKPLTLKQITVDRIIPGCLGGTYGRNNIRPACSWCNTKTGSDLGHARKNAA